MQEDKAPSQSPSTAAMSNFDLASVGRAKKQIEIGKVSHDRLLSGTQEVLNRWFERRRRTSNALASFSRDVIGAKTPHDVLKAWVAWSSGSMDRLVEDAKDQMSAGASVVRQLADGTTALALVPQGGDDKGGDGRSAQDADHLSDEKSYETQVRH